LTPAPRKSRWTISGGYFDHHFQISDTCFTLDKLPTPSTW
jgi:hypothetical protein